jgi:hypothetical protein
MDWSRAGHYFHVRESIPSQEGPVQAWWSEKKAQLILEGGEDIH